MSLKYERVKQGDLFLPAPLRWLTRAFSSITLAIILLSLVVLYGTVASVPVAFLVKGLLYGTASLACTGAGLLAAYHLHRGRLAPAWPAKARNAAALVAMLVGLAGAAVAYATLADWTAGNDWFLRHRATVIYRLPFFEMTELEFYSWWPLKLILGLFVLNMIWATLRRIEFTFPNLGVLTVHTGIVLIAVGSILYGAFKVEGDMILWRRDLWTKDFGGPERKFYDATEPAVYLSIGDKLTKKTVQVPLPRLPRYNDYPDGRLDIRLHDDPLFREVFGPNLRATIRGFISYGELIPAWKNATDAEDETRAHHNAAVRVAIGGRDGPDAGGESALLVSGMPGLRAIDRGDWALEFLTGPRKERLDDLMADFVGEHGLVVEVPAAKFRQAYAIAPGQEIKVGDTGYNLKVEQIGEYGMGFAMRGYEGARDTRAVVQVTPPLNRGSRQPAGFRRFVMHRYPEASQDFVPAPDDPTVGPMGKRVAPDPAIRLAYIDRGKVQYRLITDNAEIKPLRLLVSGIPGQPPALVTLPEDRLPLPSGADAPAEGAGAKRERWLHVIERMRDAVRVSEPRITPANQRLPKDEGTYLHALLPVDLEIDQPRGEGGDGTTWRERVWLAHMRYPELPDDAHRPADVSVPGVGRVTVAFSRESYALPFTLTLDAFEMQPYPGGDLPRDFLAHLSVTDVDAAGNPLSGLVNHGEARLNNPLIYRAAAGPVMLRKVKLSQTGWDPGEKSDPGRELRDAQGRYTHQQRFTILGVGNNVGIQIIFVGACLIAAAIPWAFYVKPWLVQRKKRKIQAELAREAEAATPATKKPRRTARSPEPAEV